MTTPTEQGFTYEGAMREALGEGYWPPRIPRAYYAVDEVRAMNRRVAQGHRHQLMGVHTSTARARTLSGYEQDRRLRELDGFDDAAASGDRPECRRCDGTGEIRGRDCPACDATGVEGFNQPLTEEQEAAHGTVVVIVQGGMVTHVELPPNSPRLVVEIRDYDTEGVDEDDTELTTDADGDDYRTELWTA